LQAAQAAQAAAAAKAQQGGAAPQDQAATIGEAKQ
jgi:ATP-binding cassette subfamily C exporter for protease/lipase